MDAVLRHKFWFSSDREKYSSSESVGPPSTDLAPKLGIPNSLLLDT